jgi:hypothetical protein
MPALAAPVFLAASVAAGSVPHLRAVRTDTPPVIDGALDDPAWRAAPPSSAFKQKAPDEGRPPSHRTTVRVLYDDDAVYVAVDCEQEGTRVVANLTRRDREVEADWVSVSLDTRSDGKSAFVFEVNAGGSQFDLLRFNDTDGSLDWDENWEGKTRVTSHGWSLELMIPLRALRFRSLPEQSWGFEVRRYISQKQETDEWSLISRTMGGEVSHYGRLDGLVGLVAKTPFEIRPFALGRVRRLDASTLALSTSAGATVDNVLPATLDFLPSAGLDLKWHPTQSLTLDGTLNPDFAQVEADQIVLNLTTFETYYPEKRPFFLEGIDTFATPMQLLYTRRIGRLSPVPTLRPNEQLLDVPQPATILGATKMTGTIGDDWTVGTLQALTAPTTVPVQTPDGRTSSRVLVPLSSYSVARVRREIGENASVGAMVTALTRSEHATDYPGVPSAGGQQLCPGGAAVALGARCFQDAYVGALDFRWRSRGGEWAANAVALGSTLDHGPTRTQADGTAIAPGDVGGGASAYFAKEGGERFIASTSGGFQDRKLEINDVGYNQRANHAFWNGGAEVRDLAPAGVFLERHARVDAAYEANTEGLPLGRAVTFTAWGKLTSFWSLMVDVHGRLARLDDREVGDGTALERAAAVGSTHQVQSDTRKPLSFGLSDTIEGLTDGFNWQGTGVVLFRALPALDVEVDPAFQLTQGEPRFVGGGPLPGEYLFGRLDAKNVSATLRATYTFTPRLTLQTFAQLFLASGHYDGFTGFGGSPTGPRPAVHLADLVAAPGPSSNPDFEQAALNVNVVLRWEYRLGSLLYVVYQRAQVPSVTLGPGEIGALDFGSIRRAPAADYFIVKLSYWWS